VPGQDVSDRSAMAPIVAAKVQDGYWQIVPAPAEYQAIAQTANAVISRPTQTNQGTQRSVNIVPLPRQAGPEASPAHRRAAMADLAPSRGEEMAKLLRHSGREKPIGPLRPPELPAKVGGQPAQGLARSPVT